MISLTPFANLNGAVPWGLWVSIYIWFIGISAGSLALVMFGNLKNILYLKKITRLGIALSLSTFLFGLLCIQIDLGHIERFYKLFTSPNPSSVMAWMVWLYGIYFVVLLVLLIGFKKAIPAILRKAAFLFALAIIIIESLLFAIPPGKTWHSLIFTVHFLTSSLVAAAGALIFTSGLLWKKTERQELLKGLSKIALPIVAINLIVEISEIIFHGNLGHVRSYFLPLCNLIVITLLLKENSTAKMIAGFSGLVMVLLSKYSALISAQIIEPFKGFSLAYAEPRLKFNYTPNIFEIFVSVCLIGLAAGLFYLLYKILPQTREG